jgi:tripartite ATP-independent transporter DctM subunit
MGVVLLFVIFISLVFLGVPVAFSIGLGSITHLLIRGDLPLTIIVQRMTYGLDSFVFLALPLFILAGQLMNKIGLTDKIFDFAISLVGHIQGSLGHVNVLASMIFAGMSGVAQADAAGLGAIEIDAMIKRGYERPFAASITAVSSIIGPIIPPSVIMAIFSVVSQISLARLFLGGFIPGIIMGICLMVVIYYRAARGKVKGALYKREPFMAILRKSSKAFPALITPLILVVGMVAGVATPTELGALCVVYALVLGAMYKQLKPSLLIEAFKESLLMMGMMVFIISCAFPFGWAVTINDIPSKLAEVIFAITSNKWIILLLVNICLLFLGCFMETTAILLIMTPVLLPLMLTLGIHPVHFGLILVINLLIGAVTPPFGVCLFIVSDIARVPFFTVARETLPFLVPLLVTLLLVTYFPPLVLFIPNLVFR